MASAKVAELYATITVKGLNVVQQKLSVFQANLKKVSASLNSMARIAKRALIPVVGALGGVVYKIAAFEKQLAFVSTMLDESSMSYLPKYRKALLDMSIEFAQSTDVLAKGLYDILSATIAPSKALKVLRAGAKAAAAGFTDVGTATSAIITILKAYGISADRASDISDKLFATVKRGRITFGELAATLGRAAATSAVAGLSVKELLASVATMTRAGLNADEAMTSVVGIMRAFLGPAEDGAAIARKFGFELNTATLRSEGLVGVLQKLRDATAEELRAMFPNIRGFRGLAAILQDVEGYMKDLQTVENSLNMTHEAFGKATNQLQFRLGQLRQRFEVLAVDIGDRLLPLIEEGVKNLTTWVEQNKASIAEWATILPKVAMGLGGLIAASSAARALEGLVKVAKIAVVAIGKLDKVVKGLSTSLKGLKASTVIASTSLEAGLLVAVATLGVAVEAAIEKNVKLLKKQEELAKQSKETMKQYNRLHAETKRYREEMEKAAKGSFDYYVAMQQWAEAGLKEAKFLKASSTVLERWKKRIAEAAEGIEKLHAELAKAPGREAKKLNEALFGGYLKEIDRKRQLAALPEDIKRIYRDMGIDVGEQWNTVKRTMEEELALEKQLDRARYYREVEDEELRRREAEALRKQLEARKALLQEVRSELVGILPKELTRRYELQKLLDRVRKEFGKKSIEAQVVQKIVATVSAPKAGEFKGVAQAWFDVQSAVFKPEIDLGKKQLDVLKKIDKRLANIEDEIGKTPAVAG